MLRKVFEATFIVAGLAVVFMAITLTLAAIQYLNRNEVKAHCLQIEERVNDYSN